MWNTFSLMLLPWVLFHKRQFWQRSYTVDDDNNQTFQVFCDFDSEPGFAWNLIESFSLSNKDGFQVFTFSLIFYKYLEHERRTKAHHQFYFLYRRTSCFTMTTKPSAVMPQIGRLTSSNDPTSFGSEITRLTGELLADTTQMAPYTQITWEPRLKTLTSLKTYPRW